MRSGPQVSRAAGFTLIELMIVVAVVAILASIALPSYNEHVRKGRRAQAKADLVEYSQQAERFFTTNNTYVGYVLPTAQSPREGGTAHYTIAYAPTQSTFTLTATAQGGQTADGCGNLEITHASQKRKTGSYPLEKCW